MPKLGMEPIRQRQFIEATMEVIHQEGLHATTLSKVARRAGTSPGLVAHYFGDKAGLMAATFQHLARELGQEYLRRLAACRTPRERALAVVEANFADRLSQPAVVSAWLSFWSQVNHRRELARVQRVVASRLTSNLLYSLRALMPKEDAARVAKGLSVFIDGLWLRATLSTGGVTFTEARELARDYLTTQLAVRQKEFADEQPA